MSAGIRAVLSNVASTIEGSTPDTRYDGNLAWQHCQRYDPDDLADEASPTRRFSVQALSNIEYGGSMGADDSPIDETQTVEVTLYYRQGSDPWELERVIAEDVALLAHRLRRPAGYDQATTGLMYRTASTSPPERDDAPGGTARVLISVTVHYLPSYAG